MRPAGEGRAVPKYDWSGILGKWGRVLMVVDARASAAVRDSRKSAARGRMRCREWTQAVKQYLEDLKSEPKITPIPYTFVCSKCYGSWRRVRANVCYDSNTVFSHNPFRMKWSGSNSL
jgi:hypothetical protein